MIFNFGGKMLDLKILFQWEIVGGSTTFDAGFCAIPTNTGGICIVHIVQ